MVKTVLGVNHQGLRDWLIQRISAIILAVYFIGMGAYVLLHPHLAYEDWQGLFAHPLVKIGTILVVLSLLTHAWVGIWTIWTDYVKNTVIRLVLHIFTFFTLVAAFFATLMILWGV